MKLINKKHDLINIQILDRAEFSIPEIGMIKLHDVENQFVIKWNDMDWLFEWPHKNPILFGRDK